jgi:hypothetical protein
VAATKLNKPRAPQQVERFIKQLNVTFKAVKLYPLSSSIPRENAKAALDILKSILKDHAEVRFEVSKEGFHYESLAIYPGHPAFAEFAREFYNRSLAVVRFHAGATGDELVRFLSVLDVPYAELTAAGGFESRLWDLEVDGVTVEETGTRIIDAKAKAAEEAEPLPGTAADVDAVISEALGWHPRAQRLLVRFVGDRAALAGYLGEPDGDAETGGSIARRLGALARAIQSEAPTERAALYASLAGALRSLDPAVEADVLGRLLAEARQDETVAAVLQSMPLEEICVSLMASTAVDPAARPELARTVRNLISLGMSSRSETERQFSEALRDAGASEEFVSDVLEEASPTHLRVRERRHGSEKPVDAVLRLLDLAATNIAAGAQPEFGIDDLQADTARGITDGDVLGALVTLATIEPEPAPFASVMAMLENNLGLLVERRDFEVAADAAESLVEAEKRRDIDETRRKRIRAAIAQLAQPDQMRGISAAMRVHRSGTPEYEACRRLLAMLGENTISSLLEVLAQEQDMTARKALVDMLSAMADRFVHELGERVSDPRWYFVRNVVNILGSTRRSDTLKYLELTLRHPDPRVRRETIRAIGSIRDALAGEMLVSALADEDAGNVQLSARHLGIIKARSAAPALEEVARGEGMGNRDVETRIDAIEALGRIASPESAPVLESLTQRSIRSGRPRELRTAAMSALAAIKLAGGGARG